MLTTIDMAGRVVIPKAIRDKAGLKPGTQIRIEERDGRVEIEAEHEEAKLIRVNGRLVIDTPPDAPKLTNDDVNQLIHEARFERFQDFLK